jgi:AcrR family transcriptional regulator
MDIFQEIDINNEKVNRIIRAGFEEFAKYGEQKASLNKILKNAGLSKGVFYHYFKDKEALLDFLIEFSIEKSVDAFDKVWDWSDGDLIKRICALSKYKLSFVKAYPYLIEFSEQFAGRINKELEIKGLNEWREKFYTLNIDYSLFKNQETLKETIHIIRWTFKGLGLDAMKRHGKHLEDKVIDEIIESFDSYYELLAKSFYI